MSRSVEVTTAEQLAALPDDGQRYELVEGVLRMMPPAGGRHGRIAGKLYRRIAIHVEQHRLGETYAAETGFLLRRNPDTVRAPDAAFVSSARLGAYADYPGYLPLAPDLVAEVLSPSDRRSDADDKARDWLAAGVRVVLVVDPQRASITVHRPGIAASVLVDGLLDLRDVIPNFQLDVAEIFT
ncbi:MAG: Uma2 family endonuclease [Pirellulaceae bacterium]|nr:Uma2 family endonuclease [Pirellulaceae bacterium]